MIVSQKELTSKYNINTFIVSCPFYYSSDELSSLNVSDIYDFLKQFPFQGMRLWPITYRPDLSDNTLAEADWLNNPLTVRRHMTVSTLKEIIDSYFVLRITRNVK